VLVSVDKDPGFALVEIDELEVVLHPRAAAPMCIVDSISK
jgi:hypothetical protein